MERENRTFHLDRSLLEGLASDDSNLQHEAMAHLPAALSRAEVSSLGTQISLLTGPEAADEGEQLAKRVMFNIGSTALFASTDLVTTDSVIKELWHRRDYTGATMLYYYFRKTKRQIINSLINYLR